MVGEPVRIKGEIKPEADGHSDGSEIDPNYIPSEGDFAPSAPKPKSPLSRFPSSHALKPALLCFALFFVASFRSWSVSRGNGLWVNGESIFARHEYWRLFTALFTHSDLGHLLSNTPLFLIFGWFLRAFFGLWVFPVAALLIGALSNLITVYFYAPTTQLVGASGMLYGMVALWLVLYVHFETAHTVPMRIFRAIAVSLLMLFPTTFQEQTSYLAHAAGFVVGIGVGCAMAPFLSVRTTDLTES